MNINSDTAHSENLTINVDKLSWYS